jgi:hypothetical protein
MSENPTTRWLGSGLFLAAVLAAAIGLSACSQFQMGLNEAFGGGDETETSVHPYGQPIAGPRDEVRAASLRCDSITDERTWLNCYYGAAQAVRADLGLQPVPATQRNLVPPAQ